MSNITVIRHQAIGNKVGTVTTVSMAIGNRVEFEAHFQLYMQSKALDSLLLIRSDLYTTEAGAIDMFDAWAKEAELLVACGDM